MITDDDRKAAEELWDHLINDTFSRAMAVEHLAQAMVSGRIAGLEQAAVITENPVTSMIASTKRHACRVIATAIREAKEQGNG
jgi:hypothetical protein